jgi:flavin reductase (DIM6/NTAB) family NADH-FMN oxidoreductase RutF
MAMGFNWAPPSVLVDVMGKSATVRMIEEAGLAVPKLLAEATRADEPKRFFSHPQINIGRFFVAN